MTKFNVGDKVIIMNVDKIIMGKKYFKSGDVTKIVDTEDFNGEHTVHVLVPEDMVEEITEVRTGFPTLWISAEELQFLKKGEPDISGNLYAVEQLKRAVRKEAKELEYTAGMNGAHDDGGASTLRNQLYWYEMGERGEYPKAWEKYNRHIDEDYAEYLRLQEKFGRS